MLASANKHNINLWGALTTSISTFSRRPRNVTGTSGPNQALDPAIASEWRQHGTNTRDRWTQPIKVRAMLDTAVQSRGIVKHLQVVEGEIFVADNGEPAPIRGGIDRVVIVRTFQRGRRDGGLRGEWRSRRRYSDCHCRWGNIRRR